MFSSLVSSTFLSLTSSALSLLSSMSSWSFVRFSNFAFTDRGSQTPLPYVRQVEVVSLFATFFCDYVMMREVEVYIAWSSWLPWSGPWSYYLSNMIAWEFKVTKCMADKKLFTKGADAVGFNGHLFGYCSEIHHLWQVTSLFLYWPTGNFGWGQINYFHWFAWMTYDNEQSKHLKEDSKELMCSVSHGLFNHHQRRPYWGLACIREDVTEGFPCVLNISLYNT